ncbi:MAG: DMT family transporter [Pseudomonadota bacterium]
MTRSGGAQHHAAPHWQRDVLGALLLTLAWVFFTAEMVGVRILSADLSIPQIAAVRTGAQAVLMIGVAAVVGRAIISTSRLSTHGMRALSSQLGMVFFYLAFALLPLALATTITFTQASFVTLFAALFLGEAIGWRRIGAVIVGFIGVLVVIRPGLGGFEPAMLVALLGAATAAALITITRSLSRTDGRMTIMFYSSLFGLMLIALPAALMWEPVTPAHWPLLALVSASGILGQFLMVGAFQLAEASVLAPVDYIRLVFAIIAGYALFAEVPDLWTWIGSAIVVLSALTIAIRRPRQLDERTPPARAEHRH